MSQYKHGVYVEEQATQLVTPALAEAALPVIVGTAPVHNLPDGTEKPVNEPMLIYNMPQFIAAFGAPADGESETEYTLYQAAKVYLTRYKVSPVVCVNVFDPAVHRSGEGGGETPDVSLVDAGDVIGGVNAGTLQRAGLALVEEVYPRFRLTPGQILAPKYSGVPAVALALKEACKNICGHFRAVGVIDVPDSVAKYTDVPAWLNDSNLTDPNLICMFGSAVYNGVAEPGSIHLAGVVGARDATTDGIPYWSPSNMTLECEGLVHAGKELHLTPVEAAYLNGNGIVTGINMIGGLKC